MIRECEDIETRNSCWAGKPVTTKTTNLPHSVITELAITWKIQISAWHTFLSCFYRKQTPSRWKLLTAITQSLGWLEPEGWWRWLSTTSPITNQKNVHKLITLCSLNPFCQTPHYPLQVGTHSFESISSLWLPWPDKAKELLLSTPPKAPSPRFNLPSVYRGWISATLLSSPHHWVSLYIFSFIVRQCLYNKHWSSPLLDHHLPI